MPSPISRWGLSFAGLSFVVYMVLKVWAPLRLPSRKHRPARQKILEAKQRAALAEEPAAKALAFREAAVIALEELRNPALASSFARRAERVMPQDVLALTLVSRSMRRGARFGALERFLWKRLAEDPHVMGHAAYRWAFDELVALYEGPMRRNDRAKALRRLGGTGLPL